ncbi:MAG: carboxypeptidase regulatory-like domain-containing protein [Planctomycetia bacterium]|nr:carboxypeptidase regulatory-like domain-containing protein [Planctomycetia bacterium]
MRLLAVSACLFVMATALGCGGGAGSLYSVKGTLKYADGTPVPRAEVRMEPVAGGPNQLMPRGLVTNGAFAIQTGMDDGAPAGKYKITIGNVPPDASDPNKPMDPAEMDKVYVPAKYAETKTFTLEFEVKSGDNVVPDITIAKPAG